MNNSNIRHVTVEVENYIETDLIHVEKDLQENEDICPHCHGTGLVKVGYNYGMYDYDTNTDTSVIHDCPYKREWLTICPNCSAGIVKRCPKCGEIIPKDQVECNCDFKERMEKRDKKRWENAKKVNFKDYDGVMIYWGDTYYEADDLDYLFTEAESMNPTEVYGTIENKNIINPDDIVQDLIESEYAYEDYEVEGNALKAIENFCNTWNEEYAEKSYGVDFNTGITFEGAEKFYGQDEY